MLKPAVCDDRGDEVRSYLKTLPSFVRPHCLPLKAEPLQLVHFDLWAPQRSGDIATDYHQGRRHLDEAISMAAHDSWAQLLFLILMTMAGQLNAPEGRRLGPVECGFIDAAAERAIVGRLSPEAPDDWAAIAADHQPANIIQARENETAMRRAIAVSKGELKPVAALYLVHLMKSDHLPIDLGVWQFACAAMNGAKS